MTPTASSDRARSLAWDVALAATALTGALPLWCARHLPFADLPQHIAAIGALRHWSDPAFGLGARYVLNVGDSQYFVYHAAGAALSLLTGSAESASRVLLTLAAVAFPYSLRALLGALERDRRLALFGAPAFWGAPLMMGFAPYVAAAPVATWAIALFVHQARVPTRRRAIGLGGLACVLFGLHLSAYVVLLGCVALVAIARTRRPDELARALGCFAPSVVLAGVWAVRGSLAMPATARLDGGQIGFLPTRSLARELPLWAYDIWRTHVDEGCAAVVSIALVALALQRGPAPSEPWLARAAWAPLAAALFAYLALPYAIGAATMLDVRMATFVVLFAPAVVTPRPGLAGSLPLLLVLVSHGVSVANSIAEVSRAEREELGDVDRLIDRIPLGASVLTLPVHLTSAHTHWPPWAFLGSYHLARRGGAAEMSFTEIRHWPIRDRETVPSTGHGLFWTLAPCLFRNAVDGPRVDFLLVRSPHDILRRRPTGPAWRAVDREREWWLYEKEPGARWPEQPDRTDLGPCAGDEGNVEE